jgi:hypothetical protein
MSQENVDVVLRLHTAFSRGHLDEVLAECQPDVTYRAAITQETEREAGDFHGHDGIRRWWSDLRDSYDGLLFPSTGFVLGPRWSALLMSASSFIVATNAVLLKRAERRLPGTAAKPPLADRTRAS